jgi:hypothetical protein
MTAFENVEISIVAVPTRADVMKRVRKNQPCHGDPASGFCTFATGKDEYLLEDLARSKICPLCPVFEEEHQKLIIDWDEWVLAMEDAYT